MLEILYQDEWLVAVNKPSGWLVHRSWLDRDEKVVVMQTVRDQIGQHVFTAHRLDRPTSGVLLMGLSSEAGRLLAQQFEQHQIQKRYHAIGAIGGFFIPKAFGSSLALTGSPVGAMKVFLIFYIACVVITWAVYGRHSKK